jgi:hypothetical protein
MLRSVTDDAPAAEVVALSGYQRANQLSIGPHDAAWPELHGAFDERKRADDDILGQLGAWIDNG